MGNETNVKILSIDGFRIPIEGERNLLQVIRKAHIELPTFCYHSELSVYGACRLCMVEVEGRGLLTACTTTPESGMVVNTQTAQLRELRRINIELLLASGNHDCPTCGKSGSCKLQSLAERMGVKNVRFKRPEEHKPLDRTSPSLVRDPNKCVLCGDCVRFCSEIQGLGVLDFANRGSSSAVMPAFGKGLFEVGCVACGQCAAVCPVGALLVNNETEKAHQYIQDKGKTVVVQVAPAVRAAIGEAFGAPNDTATMGRIVAALRRLGFDKVYDAQFFAGLAAEELGLELQNRVKNGGTPQGKQSLPLISACSQSAAKFIENFYPGLASNLSPCRDMRVIFGSMTKDEKTTAVSVEPCVSNKCRPKSAGEPDITLTVKELARMFRLAGIGFASLPESPFDEAGHGAKGQPPDIKGIKRLVADGLGEARAVLDSVSKGECEAAFVEIRSCPLTGGRARCALTGFGAI